MPLSIMSRPAPSSWPSVCPVRMYSRPNLCVLNNYRTKSIYCLTWLDLLVAFHRQRNIDRELVTLKPSHSKLFVTRHLHHVPWRASRFTSHCQENAAQSCVEKSRVEICVELAQINIPKLRDLFREDGLVSTVSTFIGWSWPFL